jgi:hypothetical protein
MHVVVMRLVLTFFVVGLTLVLVLGVLIALLGGMFALWSMHRAWLERLVAAIRRSLVLLFLFALVVVATMTAVIAILPLVAVMMILAALPAVATVISLTMFRETADLLVVLLIELMIMMHLASHAMLDLKLVFICKGAICYLQGENVLKVHCNRLKRLVAKSLPTLNILCAILGVEGHINHSSCSALLGGCMSPAGRASAA